MMDTLQKEIDLNKKRERMQELHIEELRKTHGEIKNKRLVTAGITATAVAIPGIWFGLPLAFTITAGARQVGGALLPLTASSVAMAQFNEFKRLHSDTLAGFHPDSLHSAHDRKTGTAR